MNNIDNQKQQYQHNNNNNNNKWPFTTFRSQQQQQHEQPSFILKPINEQNLSDLEQIVSATLAVQYKNPRIFQQMLRLGKRLSCVVYNQHNGQAIGAMGCRVEVIKNINNNNHVNNNNNNNNNTDDDDNQKNKNNNNAPPQVRSAIDDAISHMKMNNLYSTNSGNHSNHNNSNNSDHTLINDTTMIEQSDKKHEEQIIHVKIYLMTLSVLAPYRNLGIGAMMIQYLLSGVTRVENANPNRIIKVNGIYLHVQEGNEGALRFYSRYGFKEERFIEKYYRSVLPSGAHVLHIEFPSSSSEVSSC